MATNTKDKNKKKKKTRKEVKDFSLEDVLAVGGDKDDFEMLRDVSAFGELNTDNQVKDSEPIRKDEVLSMIQELGLDKVIPEPGDAEEKLIENSQTKEHAEIQTNNQPELRKTKTKNEQKNEKETDQNDNKIEINKNEPKQKEKSQDLISDQAEIENVDLQFKLLIKPGGKWYDQIPEDEKIKTDISASDVTRLSNQAMNVWQNECDLYQRMKEKRSSSESHWMKTVVSSGTLGDKIAALTLQVQESPVHQMKALEVLVTMSKKKGRRESILAIDTLKDLWLQDLLPENRKLRTFAQQPLALFKANNKNKLTKEAQQKRLILWYYEDILKQKYIEFVSALEQHLQDTITNIRSKTLGVVFELLSQTPEQEQSLLKFLVNKVGDPDRTVASKASHLLGSLVTKHPNMKNVIIKAVEMLLYRPNISSKTQYYAVCFLNQIILTKNDHELASKLIAIYFSFFKLFVKNSEVEAKMLSALLTGVNRAFPFAKDEEDKYSNQLDMLFKVVHIGSFNTSIQALMLLLQVMDIRQSISDRYYTALYSKLLDPSLGTSPKQAMFLNTLFKSLKMDTSVVRVKAFIKRLLQVCSGQQPSFICGVLYLISELAKIKPGIKSMIQQPEEEDDEEHFEDIPDEDDTLGQDENDNELKDNSDEEKDSKSKEATNIKTVAKPKQYDSKSRNPLYSCADGSCLWEITKLFDHYHPSVCHFAHLICEGQEIVYKGDPLQDFTLMRFLDRFIYKNPKKKINDHGGSLMQPSKMSVRLNEAPVNTNAFLKKKEENVREDEMFFYRYFKLKSERDKKTKNKSTNEEEERSDHEEIDEEQTSLDLDFAREVKMSKRETKRKKGKKEDDGDEQSSEEESSEEDFDYSNMDIEEDNVDDNEDAQQGKKRKFTDQDYEKALLENISSDEFESDEEDTGKAKKKKKVEGDEDIMSLFASADEFSHLLENSTSSGGSHDVMQGHASNKQITWEQRGREDWSHKHRNKSGRGRGLGRGRGGGRGMGRGRGKAERQNSKPRYSGQGRGGGRGKRGGRGVRKGR